MKVFYLILLCSIGSFSEAKAVKSATDSVKANSGALSVSAIAKNASDIMAATDAVRATPSVESGTFSETLSATAEINRVTPEIIPQAIRTATDITDSTAFPLIHSEQQVENPTPITTSLPFSKNDISLFLAGFALLTALTSLGMMIHTYRKVLPGLSLDYSVLQQLLTSKSLETTEKEESANSQLQDENAEENTVTANAEDTAAEVETILTPAANKSAIDVPLPLETDSEILYRILEDRIQFTRRKIEEAKHHQDFLAISPEDYQMSLEYWSAMQPEQESTHFLYGLSSEIAEIAAAYSRQLNEYLAEIGPNPNYIPNVSLLIQEYGRFQNHWEQYRDELWEGGHLHTALTLEPTPEGYLSYISLQLAERLQFAVQSKTPIDRDAYWKSFITQYLFAYTDQIETVERAARSAALTSAIDTHLNALTAILSIEIYIPEIGERYDPQRFDVDYKKTISEPKIIARILRRGFVWKKDGSLLRKPKVEVQ